MHRVNESSSVSLSATFEGFATTLQQSAHCFTNALTLKTTCEILKAWQGVRRLSLALSNDYLICVAVDHEVHIVGDEDYLTPHSSSSKEPNKVIINRLRIEIFFWLVNDQW